MINLKDHEKTGYLGIILVAIGSIFMLMRSYHIERTLVLLSLNVIKKNRLLEKQSILINRLIENHIENINAINKLI